jgi:hypothetical protein
MSGTSRMTGDSHVRICEGLGVKVPGATRHAGPNQILPRVGNGKNPALA